MNPNVSTENRDLKINCQKASAADRLNFLFVAVSQFVTDSYPVRVQHLRPGQTKGSRTSSGAGSLKWRGILQRQRRMNAFGIVSDPLTLPDGLRSMFQRLD
jgi:hypothetical protein